MSILLDLFILSGKSTLTFFPINGPKKVKIEANYLTSKLTLKFTPIEETDLSYRIYSEQN